jgi:hypothetical protein
VVGPRSGRSSPNKPARLSPQAGDRESPPQARRGDESAGIRLDSCLGCLDLWWRASQQSLLPLFTGHGGWSRRKNQLLPFLCAVASLLLIPSLAGRGGGGLGVRSSEAAEGGNPRPLPSGGDGAVEWYGKIVAARCWGLPCSDLEAPPPNKLRAVLRACRSDEPSRLALCGSGRRHGQCLTGNPRALLLLLAGLGGEEEVEDCLVLPLCWCWPGPFFELIIADALIASFILCRQGGISSTSMLEACSRHCRGCSNSLRGEVIRSPHRREGPRRMSVVGRGLPSTWSLLLGGDASRTPANGGDDAQGPDCFLSLCSRVFFVKELVLSVGWAFPRAALLQGRFCNLYSPRDQ